MTSGNRNLFHCLLPFWSFGKESSTSSATLRVSILHYDGDKHRLAPSLCFFKEKDDDGHSNSNHCLPPTSTAPPRLEMISFYEFQKAIGTKSFPSAAWTNTYTEWRDRACSGHSDGNDDYEDNDLRSGYNNGDSASRCPKQQALPVFHSVEELQAFNQQGQDLVKLLRQELQTVHRTTSKLAVEVEDYVSILSSVQVGESWWHVRDFHYGFVVPIQLLPVSTNLKSRLQAWRFRKGECLRRTDQQTDELRQECLELENSIVLELNATRDCERIRLALDHSQGDGDEISPMCSNNCDSTASVAHTAESFDKCARHAETAVSSSEK